MTENVKKFLEFVSKNEALKNELKDAKDPQAMLKIAESHGFKLSAEDFKSSGMEELSEDEMKAVSGGSFCGCGNAGSGSAHNLDCFCSDVGSGKDPEGGNGFCVCAYVGLGWN